MQTINKQNMDVELTSQMWSNYGTSAGFYLESTGAITEPARPPGMSGLQ
jgi:hypothetical protein